MPNLKTLPSWSDTTDELPDWESTSDESLPEWNATKSEPPTSGIIRRTIGDPLVSLAKGVVQVPESIVGLLDIPTLGRAGKLLEAGGYGFQPKIAKEELSKLYSSEQKAAEKKVQDAKGFMPTVRAMIQNPSTIVSTGLESVPSMLGGAGIARKAISAVPKLAPVVAGAVGEGLVGAGQAAEQLRQESSTGTLTPKQAALSTTSGAATGLIGVVGGKLAKRLGIADVDTLLAGGKIADTTAKKNVLRRAVESAISEGALEELPQSAQEQIQSNIARGRPKFEGVAEAAATGLLTGLTMGAAGGGVSGLPTFREPNEEFVPPTLPPDQTSIKSPRPDTPLETLPITKGAPAAPVALSPSQRGDKFNDIQTRRAAGETISPEDLAFEAEFKASNKQPGMVEQMKLDVEKAKKDKERDEKIIRLQQKFERDGKLSKLEQAALDEAIAELSPEGPVPSEPIPIIAADKLNAAIDNLGTQTSTKISQSVGRSVSTIENLDQLLTKLKGERKNPRGADAVGRYKEAIEEATKSGSAIPTGSFPDYDAPLDFRKPENRAVAEWLVKNGRDAAYDESPVKQIETFLKDNPQPVKPPTKPDSLTGMGGALPEEVTPAGTALKNATGELERLSHGLPDAYPTTKHNMAAAWVRSAEILEGDPQAGQKLADELKQNPERGMTDDDSALLLRHKVALENAKNQAASDTITAFSPEAKAAAQARFDDLSNQLLDLLDAAKFRGSQWGREGRWRQALAFEDYSLESMRRDRRLSLDRELTAKEEGEVKKLHERIAELERQLAEKTNAETEKNKTDGATESVRQAVSKSKDKGAKRDLAAEESDAIQYLKEHFIENGDLVDANSTIQKLMELLARKGITERIPMEDAIHKILTSLVDPTITRQEAQDLMSGYGKFKPLSKDPIKAIVRDVKGQIQQVRKLLDFFQNKPPAKTGVERRIPSDKERELVKVVNEAKKSFKEVGEMATDPAGALKSALDAINTRLKNRLRDLKQEVATRQRIVTERAASPYNEETLRLRKEIEEVQKQHEEIFGKRELTDEQRLKMAEESAKRQIVELQRQIDSGEIFPKTKIDRGLRSEILDAAKARIEALKFERDAERETIQPTIEPEIKQLQQILQRLRNREAEYQERLATGRFDPKPRKEQPVSNTVLDAQARVEVAKRDFQKALELDKARRRSLPAKIYAGLKEGLNLPRAVLSAFDVSAVLRQGGFIGFGHPIRSMKSIGPMFKALASEKQAMRTDKQIQSRPNAPRYKESGLYLAAMDEFRLSRQEEIMMSRFANVLPGVRQSNRAFMTFLNKLRADSFDTMTNSLESRGTKLTKAELEAISNYINIATGRGDLGKAAGAAETLATAFFSPRLVASRFQLLAGQPAYGGSKRTRALVAKEYARTLTGISVILGLGALAGAELEDDPRSSDFGKMQFGNTRVDPLMGLSQNTVLLSRLATGETKTSAGKLVPIRGKRPYGGDSAADLIARYARTKLAPTVGATVNVLSGENVVGEPVTQTSAATDLLVPLSMKDILDVMEEQGVPRGTAFGILSLFGMSLQNYKPKAP